MARLLPLFVFAACVRVAVSQEDDLSVNVPELRICICADSKGWTCKMDAGKAIMWHIGHKACGNWPDYCSKCHDYVLEKLAGENGEVGDSVIVQVGQDEKVGRPDDCARHLLKRTTKSDGSVDEARRSENEKSYVAAAEEARKLLATGRYRHPKPRTKLEKERLGITVLDFDKVVPAEHLVGILRALSSNGVVKSSQIRFAMSPDWASLFKKARSGESSEPRVQIVDPVKDPSLVLVVDAAGRVTCEDKQLYDPSDKDKGAKVLEEFFTSRRQSISTLEVRLDPLSRSSLAQMILAIVSESRLVETIFFTTRAK